MPRLSNSLRTHLRRLFGDDGELVADRPVAGGCIHEARLLRLSGGREVFLKSHASPPPGIFTAEAAGLRALGEAGVLRVPEVLAVVDDGPDGSSFLLLEAVTVGPTRTGFFEAFGAALARLHVAAQGSAWGFEHDNFLGATPQPNGFLASWPAFWAERRLGFQIDLARRRGLSDPELDDAVDRLLHRLPALLGGVDEAPALLHGDLWSGNYMVDDKGRPVLIDPATYYGHREAELAMCRLFGGFPSSFYAAYTEEGPLAPGHPERGRVYELYHLLNHLNLFGRSYRASCLSCLRPLL